MELADTNTYVCELIQTAQYVVELVNPFNRQAALIALIPEPGAISVRTIVLAVTGVTPMRKKNCISDKADLS